MNDEAVLLRNKPGKKASRNVALAQASILLGCAELVPNDDHGIDAFKSKVRQNWCHYGALSLSKCAIMALMDGRLDLSRIVKLLIINR